MQISLNIFMNGIYNSYSTISWINIYCYILQDILHFSCIEYSQYFQQNKKIPLKLKAVLNNATILDNCQTVVTLVHMPERRNMLLINDILNK